MPLHDAVRMNSKNCELLKIKAQMSSIRAKPLRDDDSACVI